MEKICVIGSGHTAIIYAACLAHLRHRVVLVSSNFTNMDNISKLDEPMLVSLVEEGLNEDRLYITDNLEYGLDTSDIIFLSEDAEILSDTNACNLINFYLSLDNIANKLNKDIILVVTTQVPVGLTNYAANFISTISKCKIDVAYITEFLRIGNGIDTFMHPDRVVIGCEDNELRIRLKNIYINIPTTIFLVSIETAEISKLVSNAFLATTISFANSINDICSDLEINISNVMDILKADTRIGKNAYLNPGNYGGHLGRDINTLIDIGSLYNIDTSFLKTIQNDNRKRYHGTKG